jgi:hypothetical protein
MQDSLPHRLTVAFTAAAAASALAAAPALATEGPNAPPPAAPMTGGVAPLAIAPLASSSAPTARSSRVISSARLVPKRVQRGRRAKLKISLSTRSRLRVVMRRRASGHKIRSIYVPAGKRTITVRLPKRSNGHALRKGRYGIRIVSIDAEGVLSSPIVRTLVVRAAG